MVLPKFFLRRLHKSVVILGLMSGTVFAQAVLDSKDANPILASAAGNVVITATDVLSELNRAPPANRKAIMSSPDAVQQLVSNLLVRRSLAEEAKRDDLAKDALVAAALAVASDRVLSDARLAKLDAQNTPSQAALDAYARNVYKADPAKFEQPAQTRASHILLSNNGSESLQKANEILAKLRAGASFEEIAKADSTDTGSAARGGDLGFFSAGQMVRPFEDALNKLVKPGDLSEPVETQFGYHIIRLDERREKGVKPYEAVSGQLHEEARQALLNESRVQKVVDLTKHFTFHRSAIHAFANP